MMVGGGHSGVIGEHNGGWWWLNQRSQADKMVTENVWSDGQ